MKFHDAFPDRPLKPHKLPAREVPHLTIEPNKTCNIRCVSCYSTERGVVKSLEAVKAEIDLGLERRNLETITLLGGEPTLHPDILAIVEHVKRRGLVCMLLTNGVVFLKEGGQWRLDSLIEAGIDRVLCHVDEGQAHVHGDVGAARRRLFDLLESRGVWFGLSVTIQRGQEGCLPTLMKQGAAYRYFDGVLATLAMDFDVIFQPGGPRDAEPDLRDVHDSLATELQLEPTAYIPSSVDDDEVAWLMYIYYLNGRTGRTFPVSPGFSDGFRALYRRLTGRQFFAATMSRLWAWPSFALTGALELARRPARLASLAQLLRGSGGGDAIRYQYIIVQQSPRVDAEGRIHFCWQCPDATIRHGRVTPVCIADRLDPLGESPDGVRADPDVADQVWHHLGETPPTRPE